MSCFRVVLRNSLRLIPKRGIQTSSVTFCGLPGSVCVHGKSQHYIHKPSEHILPGFSSFQSYRASNSQGFASNAAVSEEAEPAEDEQLAPEDAPAAAGKKVADSERDPRDRTRLIPWQTSAEYLKSQAYFNTYGQQPVWKPYRRPHKGGIPPSKTRRMCVKEGKIAIGSPCPICRDEYLVLDYRNTELLKQFISPYSGEVLSYQVTNICQAMHNRLLVELAKASHFGTMSFKTPFRTYDYADYYKSGSSKFTSSATRNHIEDSPSSAAVQNSSMNRGPEVQATVQSS
ncbi:uncharacterized protein LOC129591930 [Paramacrobiotus metropolitanus]|uniref:uncharacterized protein LOC129591930 n=1 Tax=Paramacrobiotus metropolitanus TaxID=2943436 RepID=UPI0024456881|nr:uncharacterized protein LOC129591930 [Paramacrobiotus metropolitanus]